jgi:HD-GYP domain-containing protein (c-di-GMP phosphodiesterase class II)
MDGCQVLVSHQELLQVSEMFARIIDGKSPFTHRHSRLVSQIALYLAGKMGFNQKELQDMKVAGLLHDLGKLTVPDEILEKPGKLSQYEFNIMKQHTYYTFQILNLIEGFESINQWASFHHEKLNGSGYPFHLNANDLSPGARIMAVSDIYSALVEDRPYRRGLERNDIFKIMGNQVKEEAIDEEIVMLLWENITGAETIAAEFKN